MESRYADATTILERETGIEPATNSLEGCDSTTELLPPNNSPQLSPVNPGKNSPDRYRNSAWSR
jgi:hypothetical protein